jgi:hypothetical protein
MQTQEQATSVRFQWGNIVLTIGSQTFAMASFAGVKATATNAKKNLVEKENS